MLKATFWLVVTWLASTTELSENSYKWAGRSSMPADAFLDAFKDVLRLGNEEEIMKVSMQFCNTVAAELGRGVEGGGQCAFKNGWRCLSNSTVVNLTHRHCSDTTDKCELKNAMR